MHRTNESILPSLLFLWAWWKLGDYPGLGADPFLWAVCLWFVGLIAVRMLSSAVHQRGFWGWVLILELATWYGVALWYGPLEPATRVLLLWGVATPLLFAGNVWRRAYERFPLLQGVMRFVVMLGVAGGLAAVPVFAWRSGPDLLPQLGWTVAEAAAVAVLLYYGWRLAAPSPSGQYDARIGSFETFKRRGVSGER